jgi:hypothetical protein
LALAMEAVLALFCKYCKTAKVISFDKLYPCISAR